MRFLPLKMMVRMMGAVFGLALVGQEAATAAGALYGAEMPAQCDNARFVKDQAQYDQRFSARPVPYGQHLDLPEHICGKVIRVYRSRHTRSGWHGYFLMSVSGGAPLRIVSNLDEMSAPAWPWVKVGDQVEVQGRYYYDGPHRQGLDWTHHGTSRRWPWAGFVSVNGQRYQ